MTLFGGEFAAGAPVLRILLATAPIEAVTITLNQDLQARGRFWTGFALTMLPVSLTTLSLAAYLIPSQGASGLAYAWMAGWSVGLVATFAAVRTRRTSADGPEGA
jgi:O-antigen/teichoic acid export membrane protein